MNMTFQYIKHRPTFLQQGCTNHHRPRHPLSRNHPPQATATSPPTTTPPSPSSPAELRDAALSKNIFPDLQLAPLQQNSSSDFNTPQTFDLVIAGAGPSGLAVADRVSSAGFKVLIIDPNPTSPWINNYGVWCDEFEALGLDDCYDIVWQKAVVYLDSTEKGKRELRRPYARVDRPKLKRKLLEQCISRNVTFHKAKVDDVVHKQGRSIITCSDGTVITGSMVLDATGHSRKLIKYDKPFNPGYQGAYGIVAEVEEHPFDVQQMLFMDWRDDHLNAYPDLKASNAKLPTFLYAMPYSPTKIFLEETSLVARPIIPFPELKARLEARLKWLGIKVKSIEEEEYCAIPMGGCLPIIPQRVVGIGGTAGMVHPSTGYMVSRVLGAAPTIADSIVEQLSSVSDKAVDSALERAPRTEEEADTMSAKIWAAMWPVQRIRQREFFDFGMEVLLKLDLVETREFFSAFFSLSDFHWQGFLSSRLGFLQLIGFGLSLFAQSSNVARANLLQKGFPGLVTMLTRLAKTLGK
jgi:lycopene beta-cyclase